MCYESKSRIFGHELIFKTGKLCTLCRKTNPISTDKVCISGAVLMSSTKKILFFFTSESPFNARKSYIKLYFLQKVFV